MERSQTLGADYTACWPYPGKKASLHEFDVEALTHDTFGLDQEAHSQ